MKRFILLLVTLLFSAFALAAVNINTATKEELDALPEIGPVKAQAIIDYRAKNGPFKTPEDIMKVSGIKEGTYAKIKGHDLGQRRVDAAVAAAPAKAETPSRAGACDRHPRLRPRRPRRAGTRARSQDAPRRRQHLPAAEDGQRRRQGSRRGGSQRRQANDAKMTKAEKAKADKEAKAKAKEDAAKAKADAAKAKEDAAKAKAEAGKAEDRRRQARRRTAKAKATDQGSRADQGRKGGCRQGRQGEGEGSKGRGGQGQEGSRRLRSQGQEGRCQAKATKDAEAKATKRRRSSQGRRNDEVVAGIATDPAREAGLCFCGVRLVRHRVRTRSAVGYNRARIS